ncbi:MAG: hypothetical protein R3190_16965, partial [Thermoanaerobaculia bacterium]|nr:hypothetical protein [Thermoanaerobaculia bacterium]
VRRLESIGARVGADRRRRVRYEELGAAPETVARRIAGFLGEAFEGSQLDVDVANSSYGSRQPGIFTTSVGRWRECLGPEELHLVQKVCRPEMAALGYELAPTAARALRLARLWSTLPPAAIRALWVNRGRRGSLLRYLARRLGR